MIRLTALTLLAIPFLSVQGCAPGSQSASVPPTYEEQVAELKLPTLPDSPQALADQCRRVAKEISRMKCFAEELSANATYLLNVANNNMIALKNRAELLNCPEAELPALSYRLSNGSCGGTLYKLE